MRRKYSASKRSSQMKEGLAAQCADGSRSRDKHSIPRARVNLGLRDVRSYPCPKTNHSARADLFHFLGLPTAGCQLSGIRDCER